MTKLSYQYRVFLDIRNNIWILLLKLYNQLFNHNICYPKCTLITVSSSRSEIATTRLRFDE
jgi:hypothetical protein